MRIGRLASLSQSLIFAADLIVMRLAIRTLLLTFLIFTADILNAQDLVNYSEVTFNSDLEKKFLDDHFLNNKTDYFNLFMANGTLLNASSVANARKRFYDHIEQWRDEKFQAKKADKKVKAIYDNIHSAFLSKYEVTTRFETIFSNGIYNCVSSSALYGLAFNELNIPFSIKEQPTHVYLIAYPSNERIMVETTSPLGGFYKMNDQFKANYLKVLKDQKLISAKEFTSTDTETLFDKYYFQSQGEVTLLQLAGLQYANDGIILDENKEHLAAFRELEKAYLLYPSDRVGYMLMVAGARTIESITVPDTLHAQVLGKVSRYKRYGITDDMIKGDFYNAIRYWLNEKSDRETAASYHSVADRYVTDIGLKNELAFLFHYENAVLSYNRSKYKEALASLETCMGLKPAHAETTRMFIQTLAQSLRNTSNKEVIGALESYSQKFPTLLQDNNYNQFLCNSYLAESANNFKTSNATTGERYKQVFEKFYSEHKDVPLDEEFIGQAYSAAAVYYFRKGQTSKAKSVVNEGLKLSPDNYQLKMSQRMLE